MEFLIQLVLEQGMFCNSGWYGPCCMSGRLLLWIGVCILLCLINTITYSSKKKKIATKSESQNFSQLYILNRLIRVSHMYSFPPQKATNQYTQKLKINKPTTYIPSKKNETFSALSKK